MVGRKCWYVIQSKAHQENLVIAQLTRSGIRSFFPLIEYESMQFGRIVNRIQPLFPSYLFACFDYHHQGGQIVWNYGLKRIVSFSGEPACVPLDVVRLIRMRADRKGIIRMNRSFSPNQPVRIVGGPFKDMEAIFVAEMSGTSRVKVLLSVMGTQPRLELPRAMLRPM